MSLYIHCTMGQAGVWSNLFSVIGTAQPTVELPGHGRAPKWDVTKDYQAQACELAIAELSGPSHIVGHSYGAVVALQVAVDHPEMVRSLTLIEPPFFKAAIETDPMLANAYKTDVIPFREAMEAGNMVLAAELFSDFWGGLPWAAMRPEQQDYIAKRIPIVVATEAGIVDDTANLWARLPNLKTPTLLLEGRKSPEIIPVIQKGLCDQLPNARRHVIDKADHMGPIVLPKPYAAAILAFQERN